VVEAAGSGGDHSWKYFPIQQKEVGMPKFIDLTMAVEDHFRWRVERRQTGDFSKGDQFQITWVGWAVHGFTHIDAPRHMLSDGKATDDIALSAVIGDCAIFNLSDIEDNAPIGAEKLVHACREVHKGDIALIKAEWDLRYSAKTAEFWTKAPYMTRDAAAWLLESGVKSVAFDFPQDYPIRLLLKNEVAPLEEFVTHDVLLRNEVILIEYLCNTAAIQGDRTTLYALPLKIPQADGAPARVIAIEEE
jgi:arylformamidase